MRSRFLVVLLLVGALASAAHADEASSTPTKRAKTARIGATAPDFSLAVVQGESSGVLSDYRGQVVVLKFWATYCGYCKSIRPALVAFADKHAAIALLAISFQGTKKLGRYLRKNVIGAPVLHDKRARIARRYRARATPTLLVIDQCGVLRFHRSGARAAKKAMKTALDLVAAGEDPDTAQGRCVASSASK